METISKTRNLIYTGYQYLEYISTGEKVYFAKFLFLGLLRASRKSFKRAAEADSYGRAVVARYIALRKAGE